MPDADPTLERLEDQIGWYDHKSNFNQRTFKWMKVIEIGAAGLVPLFSGFKLPWVAGSLGALIAILEGVLQLNQYHYNWITYRSTCESLKHEKYLYLAGAGLTLLPSIPIHSWRKELSRWFRRSTPSGRRGRSRPKDKGCLIRRKRESC